MLNYTENSLLKELSEGNALAFAHLVKVYHERLFYFSQHYLNDRELAKDIVQDVFAIVWEKKSKFSEIVNLSSWLFTLTKNQCLKKIEQQKVKQKYVDDLRFRQMQLNQSVLADLDTSPLIFDEIKTITEQTLNKLSPQVRRMFEMSRFENKKYKEIANELNVSVKTVEAGITKSLKLLRPALKKYLPIVLF